MATDGTLDVLSKKERLQISRQRDKLEHQLGTIANMTRLPAAVFVVDIIKEHIAISEARKLNIPTFAIVDTNSDPNKVDFAIPANDDSSTSIRIVVQTLVNAIKEGIEERKEAQATNKLAEGREHDREEGGEVDIISPKYAEDEEEVVTEGGTTNKPKPHPHGGGQRKRTGGGGAPGAGGQRRGPVKR